MKKHIIQQARPINAFIKLFLPLSFLLFVACSPQIKEVYIPIKCEIPERAKPQKAQFSDFTQFQVALRTYYKNIEQDLYFCRTGKRATQQKPP